MTRVALVTIVVLLVALGTLGPIDTAHAASIPGYFADEWVGVFCVTGPIPAAPVRVKLLIQMNFDKSTNGGITLAKADQLFEFLRTSYLNFSATAVQTCAIKPSQVVAQFNVNGLQAAQQLTGTFQNYGFDAMVILDSFWNLVESYLNQPQGARSLRSDTFVVIGNNNVFYRNSSETLESQIQ